MAKGKVDRRVQSARQLLHDALISLILEKRYDRITVQELIDRASVGRSTFYAHYLDKRDLLESGLEELREELGQDLAGDDAAGGNGRDIPATSHTRRCRCLWQDAVTPAGRLQR